MSPVYLYKCPKCGMTLTVTRGIKEQEHKPVCINDAQVMLRQYDSAPAITFKGTGWGKD